MQKKEKTMGFIKEYIKEGEDGFFDTEAVTCAFAVADGFDRIIYKNTLFSMIPHTDGDFFEKSLSKACGRLRKKAAARENAVSVFRTVCGNAESGDSFYFALCLLKEDGTRILCLALGSFAGFVGCEELEKEPLLPAVEMSLLYAINAKHLEKRLDIRTKRFLLKRAKSLAEYTGILYNTDITSRYICIPNEVETDIAALVGRVAEIADEALRDSEYSVFLPEKTELYALAANSKYIAASAFCAVNLLLWVAGRKNVEVSISKKGGEDYFWGISRVAVRFYCRDGENSEDSYALLSGMYGELCFMYSLLKKAGATLSTFLDGEGIGIEFTFRVSGRATPKRLRFFEEDDKAHEGDSPVNTDESNCRQGEIFDKKEG